MDGDEVISSRQIFDRLMALTAALGLQQDDVCQSETDIDLDVGRDIPADRVSKFRCDMLTAVISDWSDKFTLEISSTAGIRPYTASSAKPCNEQELSDFFEDIAASPTATLRVRVRVDKTGFIERHCSGPEKHLLYIFTRNLVKSLQASPDKLQNVFFSNAVFQCHCVLLEEPIAISGPHLFIHQDFVTPAFRGIPPRHPSCLLERIADIQHLREENTRWLVPETYLTPMHFVIENGSDSGSVPLAICRLQYALIIFYLAETVRDLPEGYLATFPGLTRTVVLIPKERPLTPINTWLLYRLFRWCYSERTTDKLDIARSTISSVLADDRVENYEFLPKHAERIWSASRSTYRTLVHDIVAKHFEKLKQLQDYINSMSSDLASKVSTIVSSLTTNTLAAIGVVLGAFVAYAFDSSNKIRPDVFKFGLFVYGFYILAFPLTYSLLLNNLTDYIILKKEFKRGLERFEAVLGIPGLSEQRPEVVKARSRHFWVVLILSGLVYAFLAVICFLLSKYLVLPQLT
jgi:hypothetical protein